MRNGKEGKSERSHPNISDESNRLQSGERKRAPLLFLERTHRIGKCCILHGYSITSNATD